MNVKDLVNNDLNKYQIKYTKNYYFYEIKLNLILIHIFVNLKNKYNDNLNLIQEKFNIIVYLIKKYVSKNYDVKINILLNLIIYKFLKYITITDSQTNTVLS